MRTLKYTKTFEVSYYNPIGVCWEIILKPSITFIIAKLDKIGMPKVRQKKFIDQYENLLQNMNINITEAVISIDNNELGIRDDKYSWTFSGNVKSFEILGYEYKGIIVLTAEEEEECRMKEEAKKYNL